MSGFFAFRGKRFLLLSFSFRSPLAQTHIQVASRYSEVQPQFTHKKNQKPNPDFWPNRIDQHYVEKMKKDWRGSFILHRPTTELQAASDQNTLLRVVHLNYSCNFLIFNIKVRKFYPTLHLAQEAEVDSSLHSPHMAQQRGVLLEVFESESKDFLTHARLFLSYLGLYALKLAT